MMMLEEDEEDISRLTLLPIGLPIRPKMPLRGIRQPTRMMTMTVCGELCEKRQRHPRLEMRGTSWWLVEFHIVALLYLPQTYFTTKSCHISWRLHMTNDDELDNAEFEQQSLLIERGRRAVHCPQPPLEDNQLHWQHRRRLQLPLLQQAVVHYANYLQVVRFIGNAYTKLRYSTPNRHKIQTSHSHTDTTVRWIEHEEGKNSIMTYGGLK